MPQARRVSHMNYKGWVEGRELHCLGRAHFSFSRVANDLLKVEVFCLNFFCKLHVIALRVSLIGKKGVPILWFHPFRPRSLVGPVKVEPKVVVSTSDWQSEPPPLQNWGYKTSAFHMRWRKLSAEFPSKCRFQWCFNDVDEFNGDPKDSICCPFEKPKVALR